MNILLYHTICVKVLVSKKKKLCSKSINTDKPILCIMYIQNAEQFHSQQNINAKLIYETEFLFIHFERPVILYILKISLRIFLILQLLIFQGQSLEHLHTSSDNKSYTPACFFRYLRSVHFFKHLRSVPMQMHTLLDTSLTKIIHVTVLTATLLHSLAIKL